MKLRFLFFISTVLLALGLAGVYMVQRSVALCAPLQSHSGLLWGAMGTFVILQFGVPTAHRFLGLRLAPLHWLSYVSFSLVSTFFLYLAGVDLIHMLLRLATGLTATSDPWFLAAAAGLTVLSAGIGMTQCYQPVRVKPVEIPIRGLPAPLSGFRIAQITDLHLGPLLAPSRLARIVTRANGLQADLIAVTGDLADGDVAQEQPCLDELGKLHSNHGVAFVTGNHDHYSGAGPWIEAVRKLGWVVLQNEHTVIRVQDAQLAVIGLPDPAGTSEGRAPNLERALAGVAPAAIKLLLFHPPTGTKRASRLGIHLQLSGHTHGGQYFPWSPIVRWFFDHPLGLDRVEGMWIYTSPGTGFWGPPNRFLVPPELTLITLQCAPEP